MGVGSQNSPQMRFAEDDHVVEALTPDRSDQPLDISQTVVCAENLNPSVVVMQATQDWTCSYDPGPLNRA